MSSFNLGRFGGGAPTGNKYSRSREEARQSALDVLDRAYQLDEQSEMHRRQRQDYVDKEAAKARKAAKDAAYADSVNWQDDTAAMANIGSVGGPWGTLIGAAVGTGVGIGKATDARMKHGQGAGEAFFKSLIGSDEKDRPFLGGFVPDFDDPGSMRDTISVAGSMGRAMAKGQDSRDMARNVKGAMQSTSLGGGGSDLMTNAARREMPSPEEAAGRAPGFRFGEGQGAPAPSLSSDELDELLARRRKMR